MSTSSALSNTLHCVRSVSLRTRSNPITIKVEEYLNKIKVVEASSTATSNAKSIQSALVGIKELYKCDEDFIHVLLIHKVLIEHRQEKPLDASISLLDVYRTARKTLVLMKGGVQDLQSALRRKRVVESSEENQTSSYICLRIQMKKNITTFLQVLRKLNERKRSAVLDQNHHLEVVVRFLRETSNITVSILRCLLSFLSSTDTEKNVVGWSLIPKVMMNREKESFKENENTNEVERVDIALYALCGSKSRSHSMEAERVQVAQKTLKALEVGIGSLEGGLDNMYHRLIQTRVSLLNALNH